MAKTVVLYFTYFDVQVLVIQQPAKRQGEERFSDDPKSAANNKDFREKKKEERKKEKTLKTERTCLITYIS